MGNTPRGARRELIQAPFTGCADWAHSVHREYEGENGKKGCTWWLGIEHTPDLHELCGAPLSSDAGDGTALWTDK